VVSELPDDEPDTGIGQLPVEAKTYSLVSLSK
jgi:hypothetical protein